MELGRTSEPRHGRPTTASTEHKTAGRERRDERERAGQTATGSAISRKAGSDMQVSETFLAYAGSRGLQGELNRPGTSNSFPSAWQGLLESRRGPARLLPSRISDWPLNN